VLALRRRYHVSVYPTKSVNHLYIVIALPTFSVLPSFLV
jgi:hypothetical protein